MKLYTKTLILLLVLPILLLSTVTRSSAANPAIIGGEDAKPGEFPFLVALVSTSDDSQFCDGSLIDKDWVLTAAHCFFTDDTPPVQDTFATDVNIKMGITDLTDPSAQVIGVAKIFQPGYDGDIHDIALLKLKKSAQIDNKLVATIKFNDDPKFPALKTAVWLAGWGATDPQGNDYTDTLKKVIMPIASCDSDVEREYVCAGKKGKDSCEGDSGGPLVVQQGSLSTPDASEPQPGLHALEIGIVSFGDDTCFQLSAYTRTSSYAAWITKTMKDNASKSSK